jgi:peptidoglycan/xylan/chitin deacetylase (PgdA/CDA1 family)
MQPLIVHESVLQRERPVVTRRQCRAARAIASSLSPAGSRARLTVFTYHQVLERRDPLRPGEPDVRDFECDIDVIGQVFTVLPLAEAVRRMAERTLPARAACITFDDGYANNHTLAAPVLQAHGVPATFFIAGGAVDDGVMWNDLVIDALARGGSPGGAGSATGQRSALDDGSAAVAAALNELKYRPLEERRAAAERLYRDSLGEEPPRLMMTREMVADLARKGFDIGGHTMSHPILKILPPDQARAEIVGCATWIERVTGRRPTTFAYPNGRPGTDFDASHAAMVAEAGFALAVSTAWSVARRGTDPYRVPRVGSWWRHHRSLPAGLLRLYLSSYLA